MNRTVAGVHYPIDTWAGAVLGRAVGQIVLAKCGAPHPSVDAIRISRQGRTRFFRRRICRRVDDNYPTSASTRRERRRKSHCGAPASDSRLEWLWERRTTSSTCGLSQGERSIDASYSISTPADCPTTRPTSDVSGPYETWNFGLGLDYAFPIMRKYSRIYHARWPSSASVSLRTNGRQARGSGQLVADIVEESGSLTSFPSSSRNPLTQIPNGVELSVQRLPATCHRR